MEKYAEQVFNRIYQTHYWRLTMIIRSKYLEWNPGIQPESVDDAMWDEAHKFVRPDPALDNFRMDTYYYDGRIILQARYPWAINMDGMGYRYAIDGQVHTALQSQRRMHVVGGSAFRISGL